MPQQQHTRSRNGWKRPTYAECLHMPLIGPSALSPFNTPALAGTAATPAFPSPHPSLPTSSTLPLDVSSVPVGSLCARLCKHCRALMSRLSAQSQKQNAAAHLVFIDGAGADCCGRCISAGDAEDAAHEGEGQHSSHRVQDPASRAPCPVSSCQRFCRRAPQLRHLRQQPRSPVMLHKR